MTSHWETGARNVFFTIATPSNYPQMLTSQNAGSPHLFVGGRSHYNKPVLNPSIKHRLAHFIAACWAFTTNIPDCCKSLHVRLDDLQQSVKFTSPLPIAMSSFHPCCITQSQIHCISICKILFLWKDTRLKSNTASLNKLGLQLTIIFHYLLCFRFLD